MSRQVRVRKLNKSTSQQVYREDEIDSAEYKALLNQASYSVESGVEKSEEKVSSPSYLRHHLFEVT
jgi:enhancer of polycomb-like protein